MEFFIQLLKDIFLTAVILAFLFSMPLIQAFLVTEKRKAIHKKKTKVSNREIKKLEKNFIQAIYNLKSSEVLKETYYKNNKHIPLDAKSVFGEIPGESPYPEDMPWNDDRDPYWKRNKYERGYMSKCNIDGNEYTVNFLVKKLTRYSNLLDIDSFINQFETFEYTFSPIEENSTYNLVYILDDFSDQWNNITITPLKRKT